MDTANNSGDNLVQTLVNDSRHPLVIFTRGYCGYCTAVKNLFHQLGVEFHEVAVDRPEFRGGNSYQEIRDALVSLSGQYTLPQVFIGGESIGGFTETRELQTRGGLQEKLAAVGLRTGGSGEG